jgi:Flp pilus assembly protein TadG
VKALHNRRGVSLVFLAISIFVLLAFAGMAIDIAYMYFVKNELNVAADAAALAGAAELDGTNSTQQLDAREAAWKFACKNKAAGQSVFLVSNSSVDCNNPPPGGNLNSGNDADGDIVVGNWNATTRTFDPDGTPVNAVKVRPQRTDAGTPYGMGPVSVFFGKIFRILGPGSGWSFMSARAEAIAATLPRAGSYISVCTQACPAGSQWPNILSTEVVFETGPAGNVPFTNAFAWTTLLSNPTSSPPLIDLLCGQAPYQDVCEQNIYSSMGQATDVLANLESVWGDPVTTKTSCPDIQGSNCTPDGTTGWWLIVPVTADCPPGAQGNAWDPKLVSKYALVRIKAICATANQNCPNRPSTNYCNDYTDSTGKKTNNVVVVDRISCIECDLLEEMVQLKVTLVK